MKKSDMWKLAAIVLITSLAACAQSPHGLYCVNVAGGTHVQFNGKFRFLTEDAVVVEHAHSKVHSMLGYALDDNLVKIESSPGKFIFLEVVDEKGGQGTTGHTTIYPCDE